MRDCRPLLSQGRIHILNICLGVQAVADVGTNDSQQVLKRVQVRTLGGPGTVELGDVAGVRPVLGGLCTVRRGVVLKKACVTRVLPIKWQKNRPLNFIDISVGIDATMDNMQLTFFRTS